MDSALGLNVVWGNFKRRRICENTEGLRKLDTVDFSGISKTHTTLLSNVFVFMNVLVSLINVIFK